MPLTTKHVDRACRATQNRHTHTHWFGGLAAEQNIREMKNKIFKINSRCTSTVWSTRHLDCFSLLSNARKIIIRSGWRNIPGLVWLFDRISLAPTKFSRRENWLGEQQQTRYHSINQSPATIEYNSIYFNWLAQRKQQYSLERMTEHANDTIESNSPIYIYMRIGICSRGGFAKCVASHR